MRSLLAILIALVVTGCAHAPAPEAREGEVVSVSAGATTVLLRHGPEDDAVARQVRRALRIAIPVAARWGALPPRVVVTIHPTHAGLEAAAHRVGLPWLRAWARRVTVEVQSPRTWSRGEATDEQLIQLLAHELTHCALYAALGGDAHRARGVPFWFWEGMATTNAGERFAARDAANGGPLTVLAAFTVPESPRAYAGADQAFRALSQRYGDERIRRLVARVRDGAEFPDAFHEVMGLRLDAFERELELDGRLERTRG